MSNEARALLLQPDGDLRPATAPVRTVDNRKAESIPFTIVEEFYKRPGGTLAGRIFGVDPFDFWFGRFYVGLFGLLAFLGIILGVSFYFAQALLVEKTWNLLAVEFNAPPLSVGLRLAPSGEQGLFWQLTMFSATLAFVGWLLRQVDICLKLRIGLEVPIAFGAVVSSWITLQWLRPIAMGAWGNGFPLGITHHLDWVSNIGYQYYNFFYNPFHAIGISLLFASTLLLSMHGSAILSAARRPVVERNIDLFWRNIVGYSIGEIGIHRMAFWAGAASVLFANLCIFLSGTFVRDWNSFWEFWDRLPWWNGFGAGLVLVGFGLVFTRRNQQIPVDLEREERVNSGLESSIGGQIYVPFMAKLFGNGRVGPLYLGIWGLISIFTFCVTIGVILFEFLYFAGWNPIVMVREFPNLAVSPPAFQYGLGFAPWHEGGAWLFATLFLHLCVLSWWMRIYTRARATGLGTQLAWGFATALLLYFTIYLFRPIMMHTWSQAPGHGLRAILDWTNYVSIQSGNFYYNPFHMLSIFFLLGSTLLLAMHGATIVATARYGAEREVDEMVAEAEGTHRAQLLWRWIMGFNANSYNIHVWAWWFAGLCVITGAIGLLLSGTLIKDWYAWAETIKMVAPSTGDWSQFVFP